MLTEESMCNMKMLPNFRMLKIFRGCTQIST